MTRDYEHEEFRPWYVADSPGYLELSLLARGLVADLLRKFDKRGQLRLRRLSDLSILLRLRWEGEIEPAVAELLSHGRIVWDEASGTLTDPGFKDRMRVGSAARMARKRARDVENPSSMASPSCDGSDASDGSLRGDVTSDLISSDLISGSPSRVRDQDPTSTPRESSRRATTPPSSRPPSTMPQEHVPASDPTVMPDWFAATVATVQDATGETLRPAEAWLRYHGHRTAPESRKAMSQPDAQYWLTTVDVPNARKDRQEASRIQERDAGFKARFDKPHGADLHEKLRQPTAAESRSVAQELTRRLAALPTPDRKPAA